MIPVKLHASMSGVYEAVYDTDKPREWRICFRRFTERHYCEASVTTYDSPYAARLAFEREPIKYRELT